MSKEAAPPVKIRVAKTKDEIEACYDLRIESQWQFVSLKGGRSCPTSIRRGAGVYSFKWWTRLLTPSSGLPIGHGNRRVGH